ncbi:response regulator transcription factor [Paenibacillus glucanolyticus]|uniref:response regulator transcription factor n=1 Tax=Paenibacillus glucanolyticus TaxID=59843 RepID=UPI00096F71EE|nr:response regulator transcription factor [Paenibacillus glucanolyticus]OMF76316.1 DNA-binding response regulator [Paenibacillus glucanolyticus]
MSSITILIAEDQTIVREGLETIINLEPDMDVVATTDNGQTACELVEQLRPQLVLMDIEMPVMNGIAATRQIKQSHPETIVLILTTFTEEDFIIECLANGASGYLLKDFSSNKIITSIQEAVRGEMMLPSKVAAKLAARLRTAGAPQFPAQHYNLTPRELQIAKLMTEYKNNREIADMLYITEGTVRNYISVIYEKIGMNDRTKAIPLLKHALRDFD